jgi:predicted ATPase
LRATLEWSYGLLTAPEQTLLRRSASSPGVSAFGTVVAWRARSDLGAAEATYMVADLVDKSLLVAELEGDRILYRLLDTTRAYARDKLAEAGEAACARRHAQHCLQTFQMAARKSEHAEPGRLDGPLCVVGGRRTRGARLGVRHGRRRALGVELTLATAPLWDRLMLVRENQANIERAIATPAWLATPRSTWRCSLRWAPP